MSKGSKLLSGTCGPPLLHLSVCALADALSSRSLSPQCSEPVTEDSKGLCAVKHSTTAWCELQCVQGSARGKMGSLFFCDPV